MLSASQCECIKIQECGRIIRIIPCHPGFRVGHMGVIEKERERERERDRERERERERKGERMIERERERE